MGAEGDLIWGRFWCCARAVFMLSAFIVITSEATSVCPVLTTPPFGRLLSSNGSILPHDFQSATGDTVTYDCASGYQLINNNNNNNSSSNNNNNNSSSSNSNSILADPHTITCVVKRGGEMGEWVPRDTVACIAIDCGAPPTVENAEVVVNGSGGGVGGGVYGVGVTVMYVCASGYQVETTITDDVVVVVSGRRRDVVLSVCTAQGEWHLVPACVAVSSGAVSSYNMLVIVVAIVSALCLVAICLALCCLLWALKLRRGITKGNAIEEAMEFAHSLYQGPRVINNPLVRTPKDSESSPDPLYLTPDEIEERKEERKN